MSDYDEKLWFAVRTRRNHEWCVKRQLRHSSVNTFLPVKKEKNPCVRAGGKNSSRVIFPGYIFVHMNKLDRITVLSANGAIELVGTYHGPSPIPEEQIEILKQLTETARSCRVHQGLVKGSQVKITKGALAGMRGTVREFGGRHEVIVAIEILGQSIGFDVEENSLQIDSKR